MRLTPVTLPPGLTSDAANSASTGKLVNATILLWWTLQLRQRSRDRFHAGEQRRNAEQRPGTTLPLVHDRFASPVETGTHIRRTCRARLRSTHRALAMQEPRTWASGSP